MAKLLKDFKPYYPIVLTQARKGSFQLITGSAKSPPSFYDVLFYDIDIDGWEKEQYGPEEPVDDYKHHYDKKYIFDKIFNGSWR